MSDLAGASWGRLSLCDVCLGAVKRSCALPACSACGRLVGQERAGCQRCRGHGYPGVDSVTRLGPYEGALRTLLLTAKFRQGWATAELLGDALSGLTLPPDVERVVPVPLHPWRGWLRGYNVPELLVRRLARVHGLSWGRDLRRVRLGERQSRLSGHSARVRNVARAFRLGAGATLQGRRVLLVDDILTSGATAAVCARVLRDGGARRVDVLVVAVADPGSAVGEGDA